MHGYLAAIKYFHKMVAGWELPSFHCMIVAVGKGIDKAHGKSRVKPRARKPMTWSMSIEGKEAVFNSGEAGCVVWLGLEPCRIYCYVERPNFEHMPTGTFTLSSASQEDT